jgi:hypothetical protein
MLENSPIRHKTIYNSFSKLQSASSDAKFRMKSLRIKTSSNEMEDHIRHKLGLPLIFPNQSVKKIASASPQILYSPSKVDSSKNSKGKRK